MSDYTDFEEAYEITKILEIATTRDFDGSGGPSTIRIEILHDLKLNEYSVRWSQQTDFHLQPSYPVVQGSFSQTAGNFSVWVPLGNMPRVEEDSEEKAVRRSLDWLKERGT